MEKGNIFPIFPTALVINNLSRELTEREMDCIRDYENKTIENVGNQTSHDLYVLEHPDFAEIKRFCEMALADYLDQIYEPINPDDIKLTITQSWLNFTKKGQSHHPHWHHNSVLSGCLYINADSDVDNIVFTRDKQMNWHIQQRNTNAFNSLDTYVQIRKGDVVLFPSYITHSVPETKGDHTRISLAFNSFFEGSLGFIQGLNDGVNFLKVTLPNQKDYKPYNELRGND